MSGGSEVTTVKITKTITAIFQRSEFIPAEGDRKSGGRRNARAIGAEVTYDYDVNRADWFGSRYRIRALVEQQKADGSWSSPEWSNSYRISSEHQTELIEKFRPRSKFIVLEEGDDE